jgi:5-methylcytosine-specific restriction enzyme A
MAEPRGKTAARGYGGRWQRERKQFLDLHPLCVMCQKNGHVTPATVVDHIIPHKGDPTLMWDWPNWQALCATHHNRDKQSQDKGGNKRTVTYGADGWPLN